MLEKLLKNLKKYLRRNIRTAKITAKCPTAKSPTANCPRTGQGSILELVQSENHYVTFEANEFEVKCESKLK